MAGGNHEKWPVDLSPSAVALTKQLAAFVRTLIKEPFCGPAVCECK